MDSRALKRRLVTYQQTWSPGTPPRHVGLVKEATWEREPSAVPHQGALARPSRFPSHMNRGGFFFGVLRDVAFGSAVVDERADLLSVLERPDVDRKKIDDVGRRRFGRINRLRVLLHLQTRARSFCNPKHTRLKASCCAAPWCCSIIVTTEEYPHTDAHVRHWRDCRLAQSTCIDCYGKHCCAQRYLDLKPDDSKATLLPTGNGQYVDSFTGLGGNVQIRTLQDLHFGDCRTLETGRAMSPCHGVP